MELWLLGAGAVVLIALTLWIVWPTRSNDPSASTVRGQEVSNTAMTDTARSGLPPQGDRFQDQYTSATADLSAGAVAATIGSADDAAPHQVPTQEPVVSTRGQPWPEAPAEGERIGQPSRFENFPYGSQPAPGARSMTEPRILGIGGGARVALGSAVGGAWLLARWRRERNKPINRLRRGARDMAGRISHIDVDERAAPMGGVATAVLLSALLTSRLRRGSDDQPTELRSDAREMLATSMHEAMSRGRGAMSRKGDALDFGREVMARGRAQSHKLPAHVNAPKKGLMGIGFGGLVVIAGSAYVLWRMVRGTPSSASRQNFYAGE